MEALCHPPDHPVQLGCLHLRLRTGPPQERRPRAQAVADAVILLAIEMFA